MIYILEDDSSIRELIAYTLNGQGMACRSFSRPSEFWKAMQVEIPTLVLLDIMLPEENGLDILNRLRKLPATSRLPIMMLTAKGTEYDKVTGLDLGADDYVTKPFGMMELLSRIKALLRRSSGGPEETEFQAGCIHINTAKHTVNVNGRDVTLTLKEYEVLCLLVENQGIVFTRDQLLSKIWGYDFDGESRTVDVHVRTLRQKLGEGGSVIETVRGLGYKARSDMDDKTNI